MIFDKIANGELSPINKQASNIDKGERYKSGKKIQTADSKTPIPFYYHEMEGFRFGNLTVLGYYGKINPKSKGSYVCKCDCGIYTLRKMKAIKNPNNNIDSCEECRHLKHLQRTHSYFSNKNK